MSTSGRLLKPSIGRHWGIVGCICVGFIFWLYISGGTNYKGSREAVAVKHEMDSNGDVMVPIHEIIKGKPIVLAQDDPAILQFIRKTEIVRVPSSEPYNLTNPQENPSMGQGQFIREMFKDKRDGFFVECGALDGETRSNTLTLEKEFGWKGLLVEADPNNFDILLTKRRKAWAAKACLALKPYPHEVSFWQHFNMGKIVGGAKDSNSSKQFVNVQCLPFFTLMSYLNVTSVDYFSLDVEGNELEVLKTIPFSSILIKTLSVEFLHVAEGTSEIADFMVSMGYVAVAEITFPNNWANDLIFVHSSQTDLLANVPRG